MIIQFLSGSNELVNILGHNYRYILNVKMNSKVEFVDIMATKKNIAITINFKEVKDNIIFFKIKSNILFNRPSYKSVKVMNTAFNMNFNILSFSDVKKDVEKIDEFKDIIDLFRILNEFDNGLPLEVRRFVNEKIKEILAMNANIQLKTNIMNYSLIDQVLIAYEKDFKLVFLQKLKEIKNRYDDIIYNDICCNVINAIATEGLNDYKNSFILDAFCLAKVTSKKLCITDKLIYRLGKFYLDEKDMQSCKFVEANEEKIEANTGLSILQIANKLKHVTDIKLRCHEIECVLNRKNIKRKNINKKYR